MKTALDSVAFLKSVCDQGQPQATGFFLVRLSPQTVALDERKSSSYSIQFRAFGEHVKKIG